MKKLIILLTTIITCSTYSWAQEPQQTTILWKVFCSGSIDWESFETSNAKQDFIDVKQENNKYYWGQDNVYTVYNKVEEHNGFTTRVTYDFIDKYKQRGKLIYLHNRDADWATKHVFYIQYEGIKMGKFYCSNEPK